MYMEKCCLFNQYFLLAYLCKLIITKKLLILFALIFLQILIISAQGRKNMPKKGLDIINYALDNR